MRVLVTGMGAWSAVGPGVAAIREALRTGRSGIGPITAFDTSAHDAHLGGQAAVPEARGLGRCEAFAVIAAREAWEDAGSPAPDPARIAVVVGSSAAGDGTEDLTEATEAADRQGAIAAKAANHHRASAIAVGEALGVGGPRLTVSSACASGNVAIAVAADLVRSGRFDAVIAGGVDLLSWRRYAGFCALGVVSPAPCAPFSQPVGMNLGEGAAFLVLEAAESAERRGARIRGEVGGAGLSSDGYHATAPDPTGAGIARAVAAAIADAGLTPAEVGYYNAHATGTESNDAAEWRAVERVFAAPPPTSGSKAFFGHTFGAAGPLEAIVTLIGQAEGFLPQTLHFDGPRAGGPADPIGQALPRPGRFDAAVSNNAAFGGLNAAILLGRSRRAAVARPVGIAAIGVWTGAADPREVSRVVRGADPREMDRFGAMVALAAAAALGEPARRRDRHGLFVGTSRRPSTATLEFRASIEKRGRRGASASAFSRTVLNASTGAAARVLGLCGPTATFATGPGSGLCAVAAALRWLALHDDADAIVAGGADEIDPLLVGQDTERVVEPGGAIGFGEGAACVRLEPGASVRLSIVEAGPGDLARAIGDWRPTKVFSTAGGPRQRAREDRALDATVGRRPERVPSPLIHGYADAMTGVVALAQAWEAAASGPTLVVHDDGVATSVAAFLEAT